MNDNNDNNTHGDIHINPLSGINGRQEQVPVANVCAQQADQNEYDVGNNEAEPNDDNEAAANIIAPQPDQNENDAMNNEPGPNNI